MAALPTPLRAALGLAATVVDDLRHLPDKAIELPMRAVSIALKLSLRAQQRYTALASKGDEVLSGRGVTDAAPSWARFDEPVADVSADLATTEDPVVDLEDLLDEPVDLEPVPRKRTATTAKATKTVRAPRAGARSAFDDALDEPLTDPPADKPTDLDG